MHLESHIKAQSTKPERRDLLHLGLSGLGGYQKDQIKAKPLFFLFVSGFEATTAISQEQAEELSLHSCQGQTLHVECPGQKVIKIVRANFGRFSIAVCNDQVRTNLSVNCMSPRSKDIVIQRLEHSDSNQGLEMLTNICFSGVINAKNALWSRHSESLAPGTHAQRHPSTWRSTMSVKRVRGWVNRVGTFRNNL